MDRCHSHKNFKLPCRRCESELRGDYTIDFALGDTITFGGSLKLTLVSINSKKSEVTYKVTKNNG